jgi:hypothetical protein
MQFYESTSKACCLFKISALNLLPRQIFDLFSKINQDSLMKISKPLRFLSLLAYLQLKKITTDFPQ